MTSKKGSRRNVSHGTRHPGTSSRLQYLDRGETPIVLSAVTVAEVGHGIYRANTAEIRDRRRAFLDDLKATVPIYPVTGATAEIVARIGGEQAASGINLPISDLLIGACALELGYALGTSNVRDFGRIPGLVVLTI